MTSTASDSPKVSAGFDINAEFRSVMKELGLSPEDTGGTITFVGEDPIFPSVHRLGACIGIPLMAGAAGIANIWRQRTGRGQDLNLDLRKAIHGINPEYKFMPTVNGYPYQLPYWVGAPQWGSTCTGSRTAGSSCRRGPTRACWTACARSWGARRTRTASPRPCPSGTLWNSTRRPL